MSDLKFIQAFVDFESRLPLLETAKLLSDEVFAGIQFTGLDEGIWDEVPAMRLNRDFLGLRVVVGGGSDEKRSYTLEIEAFDFPWSKIPEVDSQAAICDLSEYIREQLKEIKDIEVKSPSHG